MIDTSPTGSWEKALLPDRRDMRLLTDKELHGPFILDNLMRWHGLATMAQARDMKAREVMRRTREVVWDG